MKISLCLIAKNEEEVLNRCLDSFKGVADEIVFVDTGSTDQTANLARQYTDKIFHFQWVNDFSAARNYSFSKATHEYIMWADLDDVLFPSEAQKLQTLKSNLTKDIYLMAYDYAQDENGRSLSTLFRERLIRNTPKLRFRYPIHECIPLPGDMTTEQVDITITHKRTNKGYCSDLNRNISMLEKAIRQDEYKDDPRVHYYLAKEYFDANKFSEACEALKRFLAMNAGWWEDRVCGQIKLAQCYRQLSFGK